MQHIHSTLRYLIVVFLVASIGIAFSKWRGKKPFSKGDKSTYLMTLIFCHLQLVIGVILFFQNGWNNAFSDMGTAMKTPVIRFFTIEHTFMMLIALVFITIGYSTAKRAKTDEAKHKKTFIFYLIGFIIIMAAIPWPFRGFGNAWF